MERKTSLEYSEARGYNLGIAREVGLDAAAVYNQLLFWAVRVKTDWFYKSYEEMVEELPMSERSIRRAYDTLKKAGYIETKLQKANGAPTLHFRFLRIARMDSAKSAVSMDSAKSAVSMDSAKSAVSINNKEPIKNLYSADASPELDAALTKNYHLYLKYFIVSEDISIKDSAILEAASKRYRLTSKRKQKMITRIKEGDTLEQGSNMLAAAIVGFGRTDWSNGNNDRGWKADLADFI